MIYAFLASLAAIAAMLFGAAALFFYQPKPKGK
jgi:hypothetical protein